MVKLNNDTVHRIQTAVGSQPVGTTIASTMNLAEAESAQFPFVIAGAIVASATSQTTDFGALKVGDSVLMIPATAGNADYIPITVAGNLGQAAVIGNFYLVVRAFSLASAKALAAAHNSPL